MEILRAKSVLSVLMAIAVLLAAAGKAAAEPPGPVLPKLMDRETVKAIDRGLNYLVKTQRNDGSWMNSGGYGTYPTAMSALSGMALLGSGSTPESGRYAKNVRKVMNYLIHLGESGGDGLIASNIGGEYQSMHGHGFALLFLAECYGMENSVENEARLKKVIEKGIELTAKCQSDQGAQYQHAGGWIYTPQSRGDEGSVTVTQLQALRAARNVGLKVPKSTIDRAVAYLKHCQMPDGSICYSWSSRGNGTVALSAAGIACFFSAGVYDQASGGSGDESKMVDKLVQFVLKNLKVDNGGGHYFYTHLYAAQSMYQRAGNDPKAVKEWEDYYKNIRQKLLSSQNPDGSWSGDGVGTTYGTAIALTILQLPYGYVPIYQR